MNKERRYPKRLFVRLDPSGNAASRLESLEEFRVLYLQTMIKVCDCIWGDDATQRDPQLSCRT